MAHVVVKRRRGRYRPAARHPSPVPPPPPRRGPRSHTLSGRRLQSWTSLDRKRVPGRTASSHVFSVTVLSVRLVGEGVWCSVRGGVAQRRRQQRASNGVGLHIKGRVFIYRTGVHAWRIGTKVGASHI
ncbi:hypothetical protein BHM03_00051456, partial [Ensete ventricosum]